MTRKALVVGVDEYPVRPLQGCVNDATAMANLLETAPYGFEVTRIFNEEVTRRKLKAELQKAIKADFTVLYFAGHGCKTDISTYLVTYDTEPDDEGVDVAYLTQAISSISGSNQNVVVILDCCHAGGASVRSEEDLPPFLEARDIPSFSGNGKVVMAACMADQTAKEKNIDGTPHGVFTYYLLEALRGGASDVNQIVSVSGVYDYVSTSLMNDCLQTPVLRGDQTGRIILGNGIKRSAENSVDYIEPKHKESQVIDEALEHASKYYSSTPQYTHAEWQARGHSEACQRIEPIIDWFERRLEDNRSLLRNSDFSGAYVNIHQQYQNLCNLTPGTCLKEERKVDSLLGSGTFGTVWKIKERRVGRYTCFKSYHAAELKDSDKVGRFLRGYKAMRQLNHPNIVKVYDDNKVPLGFFMQYIDGPNLRQFNPATSLEPPQLVELLLRTGETLQHAHGRDVLHRDVKPENILIQFSDEHDTPNPYLTDFDLSWFSTATKLTRLAEGFGSHFYAAPEQMNNPTSPIAHKSSVDAYSFGQVLFFTLCGRDPAAFDESGNQHALKERLRKLSITEKCASKIIKLYCDCTIRDPNKRESDFRKICDQLSEVLVMLRSTDEGLSAAQLLRELSFSISGTHYGDLRESGSQGIISFSSPSSRTEVVVRVKLETGSQLTLEITLTPNEIVVPGASAYEARQKVNARLDAAMTPYNRLHNIRRTTPTSASYQAIVTFEDIKKSVDGLSRAREIVMHAVDAIERT